MRPTRPSVVRTFRPVVRDAAIPPRVSVVVPCFNYGRFLRESVTSALDQAGVEVDILIIDDASTDGSGELADDLAAEDGRVRVVRHKANQGHIATYNEGIDAVEGDYVVVLSADDRLTEGALGRATALLETHAEVGFAFGASQRWWGDPIGDPGPVTGWSLWPPRAWLEERCRWADNIIASPEVVVRTAVQRQVGGYRVDLPHTADLEMWLRLASVAAVGRVDGPVQALWRQHESNMSQGFDDLADLHQLLAAFRVALDHEAIGAAASRLRSQVERQLASQALFRALHAHLQRAPEATVEDLVEFAFVLWPDAAALPAWRRLRLVRRVPRSWGRIGFRATRRVRSALRPRQGRSGVTSSEP